MRALWAIACGVLCGAAALRGAEAPLLKDAAFEQGVALSALSTREPPRTDVRLFAPDNGSAPVWRMAQWGSRFDLAGARPQKKDGWTFYGNEGKRAGILRAGKVASLELTVFGGAEYGGKARKAGEDWPHLLVEQNFDGLLPLARLRALTVSFHITVFPPVWKGPGKPDPALHAAQYVMYFTVQDRNRASKGFGDYLWFGVPIYDVRHAVAPGYRSADAGKADATGKYIYTPAGSRFWKKRLDDGRPRAFSADMLPDMRAAFADAQAKGFLKNSRWDDMSLGSMNTGWEVPGAYDARARLEGLAVQTR